MLLKSVASKVFYMSSVFLISFSAMIMADHHVPYVEPMVQAETFHVPQVMSTGELELDPAVKTAQSELLSQKNLLNVTGTIQKGSVSIKKGFLHVQSETEYKDYHATIENGQFSLELPDGTYKVDSYYDEGAETGGQIDYTFTVKDGKVTPSPLEIEIPPDNVTGTIQKGKEQVVKGEIYVQGKNGEDMQGYNGRIENGRFSLYLPDGTYVVDSYYDEVAQTSGSTDYTFTVKNGKTASPSLTIEIPPDNVSGTIRKGTTKTEKGAISFLNKNEENHRSYQARIENGQFSLYLPDGTYMVDVYYDESKQISSSIEYTFTVKNGKSDPSSLTIEIPPDNVSGTIQKGSAPVTRGELSFSSQEEEGHGAYFARIENGQFSLYLPDGTYKADMYYDETSQAGIIEDYTFTVKNGKMDLSLLNIEIPPDNVSGTVQKGDTKVTEGELSLSKKDDSDPRWYSARIENGRFSLYLPDGTYKADMYYDDTAQTSETVNYEFTVKNGKTDPSPLAIEIPPDNVAGTIQKGADPVIKGEISLFSENGEEHNGYYARIENGRFSLYLPDGTYTIYSYYDEEMRKSGNADYTFTVKDGKTISPSLAIEIPQDNVTGTLQKESAKVIKGEIYFRSKNGNTPFGYHAQIENGQFSLYLPDGIYTAAWYYDEKVSKEGTIGYTFTVKGGKAISNPVEIVIPRDNVKGSIKTDSSESMNGSLLLQKKNEDLDYHTRIQNGTFRLYLPDGQYTITAYYDAETGQEMPVNHTFVVIKGKAKWLSLNVEMPLDKMNEKGQMTAEMYQQ